MSSLKTRERLSEVRYEIRGELARRARELESRGRTLVKLNIGKAQLASLLGTIPETLSRILTKLAKQGLISSDGPQITILDRDGLEDLAMGDKL